ncbi:MAG: hypothetical protein RR497_03785 [Oscillospiraceae bacterium]
MIFSNMDRIIFAGDSVTDARSACPVGEKLFDNLGKVMSVLLIICFRHTILKSQ